MRSRAVILAAALFLAPLPAKAGDLVVWWNEGPYAEENAAVREIVAAFEQKTGKRFRIRSWPRSKPESRPTSRSP
jgi:ABC-type glycerol-3-phosphate transport system substrate-binding protein